MFTLIFPHAGNFKKHFVQGQYTENTMFTIYSFLSFKKRMFKAMQRFFIHSDFSQNSVHFSSADLNKKYLKTLYLSAWYF